MHGGDQTRVEGPDHEIGPGGGEHGHVQDLTHRGSRWHPPTAWAKGLDAGKAPGRSRINETETVSLQGSFEAIAA